MTTKMILAMTGAALTLGGAILLISKAAVAFQALANTGMHA